MQISFCKPFADFWQFPGLYPLLRAKSLTFLFSCPRVGQKNRLRASSAPISSIFHQISGYLHSEFTSFAPCLGRIVKIVLFLPLNQYLLIVPCYLFQTPYDMYALLLLRYNSLITKERLKHHENFKIIYSCNYILHYSEFCNTYCLF